MEVAKVQAVSVVDIAMRYPDSISNRLTQSQRIAKVFTPRFSAVDGAASRTNSVCMRNLPNPELESPK